ncbi:hypothetical protein B0H34DRAFT_692042 [Crassisporium funariophilum]|nr:hypothetical protein B0H34DRAFT_692042 [Crassisporium funariophilum]
MSTTEPTNNPALAEAAAFFHHVKANGLDDATLAKVQAAAAEHLQDPTTREKLNEDIKTLVETIRRIDENFALLAQRIAEVDGKGILHDSQRNPVGYSDKWTDLWNEFKAIIKVSLVAATTAHVGVKDLVEKLIPALQTEPIGTESRSTLHLYIENLERFETEGIETGDRFLRLRQGVDAFSASLKDSLKEEKEAISRKFDEIDELLCKARGELENASSFFSGLFNLFSPPSTNVVIRSVLAAASAAYTAGTTAHADSRVATMVAATAALAALAPSVGEGLMLAAFSAVARGSIQCANPTVAESPASIPHWWASPEQLFKSAEIEVIRMSMFAEPPPIYKNPELAFIPESLFEPERKREAMLDKCRELAEQALMAKKTLIELNELMEKMISLDVVFGDTVERLGTIQGIWRMLITDSQRLHWKLSDIASQDDELTFMLMVKNVSVTYETLDIALGKFCSGVGEYYA